MTAPASRRGFLRDLVGLPLIGGGLTLIGSPTAVAEPVSEPLLMNYETWLACEAHRLSMEVRPNQRAGSITSLYTPAWNWHDKRTGLLPPSTRAALVLAAVGCDWREGKA